MTNITEKLKTRIGRVESSIKDIEDIIEDYQLMLDRDTTLLELYENKLKELEESEDEPKES